MELIVLGLLFLFIGLLFLLASILIRIYSNRNKIEDDYGFGDRYEEEGEDEEEGSWFSGGGVVMIGPIPIVFGTDRVAVKIAVVGALLLMAIWFSIYFVI